MKPVIYILLSALLISNYLRTQNYSAVSTFAGNSIPGLINGSLTSAQFKGPYGICIDHATGIFYVADALNNCIRKITGGTVSTLAGNGVSGDVDAQGANARFSTPTGICFAYGYVYISDNGNHKIKRIDTLGNVVTIAGSGLAGHQDGAALQSKFNNPVNLIGDNTGGLIVADYFNHCIRKISNGQVITIAGTPGVSGDQTGAALSAQFNLPTGLAIDPQANLYISDQENGRIKKLVGGTVVLVAGSGANSSVDGTGSGASFYRPTFIDFDLNGDILVVEWAANKVRRVTPSGVVTTVAGSGSSGYINGSVNAATFNVPYGICVDNAGDAYVSDKLNNVIRKLISTNPKGIAETQSSLSLTLFPNPSSSEFTLVNTPEMGITDVYVYNVSGVLCKVIHAPADSDKIVISIAEYSAGEYVIFAIGEKANGRATVIKK